MLLLTSKPNRASVAKGEGPGPAAPLGTEWPGNAMAGRAMKVTRGSYVPKGAPVYKTKSNLK